MPGRRCVVQDCGNVKNDELGISIHNSPDSGSVRLKWKRFVSPGRVHSSEGFQPSGKICCVIGAFYKGLFYACFSDERHEKEFEEGDSVINRIESLSQVQVDNFCLTIFVQVSTNGINR